MKKYIPRVVRKPLGAIRTVARRLKVWAKVALRTRCHIPAGSMAVF